MNTFERVKRILEDCGIRPDAVASDTSFTDDLGMDSLDTLELVMFVEEEFSIEVSDLEAEMCLTVDDAVKLVDRMMAG